MMCGILFAVFQAVRLVSRKLNPMDGIEENPIKTAMKCEFMAANLIGCGGWI
jgi:hypothetical protein